MDLAEHGHNQCVWNQAALNINGATEGVDGGSEVMDSVPGQEGQPRG